jgi:hypothetical protein
VAFWKARIYGEAGLSRLTRSDSQLVGERVLVSGNSVFKLGIPLRSTIEPWKVAGGYRFHVSPRIIPYAGAGIASYHYAEESDFATPAESFDGDGTGPLYQFGVEVRVHKWVGITVGGELSQVTGIPIPINKPVVGDNAFAHEAGIHQDGVLKHRQNYEIMTPESVGLDSNRNVLGKHSGRHAFVARLRELGLDLTDVDMNRVFDRFKALADSKKSVYDEDLIALIAQESVRGQGVRDRYELVYLNVTSSSMAVPHATVKLRIDGEEMLGNGTGDGMVDACFKVISDLTGQHPQLQRYAVKAITGGTDAQGEVICLLAEDGHVVTGQGSHTDIIQASALAYVNALNKLEYRRQHRQRQQQVEVGP